ncbi:MAG: phytanoyl-CoA dioxygenase family protein [Chloroflexi bacterium]|nr:phytanoyl-CoA dioxygenase family protein [Chloroflexota bacterium]
MTQTAFAGQTRAYPTIGEAERAFFAENGYMIVEGALYPDEIEHLRAETTALCRGDRGPIRGVTPADPQDADAEVLKRYLCIHFPHKLSPLMLDHLGHPVIVDVLTKVIGPNVKAMQSMLFIKAAGKPGQAWHQDEIYIPTRDRSLTGGWIALDDATVENGCLWVIPGSHRHGILWPQHHHDDRRFDCSEETIGFPYKDEDAIPVEVKAGAIVFFNGYLLHRSLPNRAASGYRRVLLNLYMSAESLLPWHNPRAGERMATADMRDIVMIAGRDPYAFKGFEDVAQAHIRPDGLGGCGDPRQNVKIESRETSALPYDDDRED